MRIKVNNAIKDNQPIPIFKNLIPIVSSLEVLQLAYSNIKSNHGIMTFGTQKQTADKMSKKTLEKISTQLKNSTYKFLFANITTTRSTME